MTLSQYNHRHSLRFPHLSKAILTFQLRPAYLFLRLQQGLQVNPKNHPAYVLNQVHRARTSTWNFLASPWNNGRELLLCEHGNNIYSTYLRMECAPVPGSQHHGCYFILYLRSVAVCFSVVLYLEKQDDYVVSRTYTGSTWNVVRLGHGILRVSK